MIIVNRLNGERFGVNAEHLERVEETPDTVLTLLDGRKYIVQESLEEVLDLVIEYRSKVLRISYLPLKEPANEPALRLIDSSKSGNGERSEGLADHGRVD